LLYTVRNTTDAGERRRDRRAARLRARALLWDLSLMARVQACGRRGVLPDGSVRVRATGSGDGRTAGFAGLATCGSVWACPVCSEKILGGRQHELSDALSTWADRGGSVAFVTLTMRHRDGQSLRMLWDALGKAWNGATKGRGWKSARERYGVAGFARVVETTHGANGWHVHVHAAFFLDRPITDREVDDLGCELFQPWRAALVRAGLDAPLARSGGMVAKLWNGPGDVMADYFAKNTYDADASRAALELARGDLKEARRGNRTPFRILADIEAFGLADDVDLWLEWEQASKGRRQLTWSRDLRALLALGDEATDEDLASDELGSEADDLVEIPAEGVRLLAAFHLHAAVLDAAEHDETGNVLRHYLTSRGVPWRDVRRAAAQPAPA
jgi:hypothetical protein